MINKWAHVCIGPETNASYLGWGEPLLRELAHVVGDLLGGDLQPRGRTPLVRERALGDTLSAAVHAPHLHPTPESEGHHRFPK